MKVYIDITLLPDDDIGHHFLWEKVFQQVHLALVEQQDPQGRSPVGISFPEFSEARKQLGRKLRLFAPDQATLERLNIEHWLARLQDYVHIKQMQPVPENIQRFVCFRRLQTKSNVERLARRAAKRHAISYEQALAEKSAFQPETTDAPFIRMKSLSSGNRYRLFVGTEQVERANTEGGFSTYGLSTGSAVPYF